MPEFSEQEKTEVTGGAVTSPTTSLLPLFPPVQKLLHSARDNPGALVHSSPHHPPRGVAAAELQHFGLAHFVEVAGDAVLEATGGHGEFQGVLRWHFVEQRGDEAAAKGV